MTPDMRRLCQVAANAMRPYDPSWDDPQENAEAIVRAVLMELREASPEMIEAGRWPAEDDGPAACLTAMIDHILAEPATA